MLLPLSAEPARTNQTDGGGNRAKSRGYSEGASGYFGLELPSNQVVVNLIQWRALPRTVRDLQQQSTGRGPYRGFHGVRQA